MSIVLQYITLCALGLHFSLAKDVKESSLTGFTGDIDWKTGDDRSAQIETKASHKSALPELTDQLTRDFKGGKSVNSVSDRFRTLFMRGQNPCVDHYVWERTGCGDEYQNVPRCRRTSLAGCSSSIRCHGTRKCITIKEISPNCSQGFITKCECAEDKCNKTENWKKIV
ncbi:uncharacterized protein LOC114957421 [Acropora millepora]|uniref:uncharacterized protein LOC114957421 n=1 Tax=Acropora millepora TaxID=45264 RepID=UPI001CF5C6A2|nr:uncharacterized protein LOC114957421 [Acropora millepora]